MRYKKFKGFTFAIDRPEGYVKTWSLPGGGVKRYRYPVDYGYFPQLIAGDGEGLDAFVGDTENGHFESFEKLKPAQGGGYVHDEFKFIVGLSDAELRLVYTLYNPAELNGRRVYPSFEALVRSAYAVCGRQPPNSKTAMMLNPTFYVTPDGPQQMESQDFDHVWGRFQKQGAAASHRKLWPYGIPVQLPLASDSHLREPQQADVQGFEEDVFDALDRGESYRPDGDESAASVFGGEDKTSEFDPGHTVDYSFAELDKRNPEERTRSDITQAFETNEALGDDSSMSMPGVIHHALG